ncbi:MAG: NADH-quinone oxidoreductase subunit M [Chloroflexi bacterium]|nr:NADH-quinone oxidoreductase subunit M [Chloroflexota bacterium]
MTFFDTHALEFLVFLPVVAAVVILLVPAERPSVVLRIAWAAGALMLVGSLYVFVRYDYTQGGFQLVHQYRWLDQLGISLKLAVDGISTPMVLLTGVVIFAGTLVSWNIGQSHEGTGEHGGVPTTRQRNKDFFILLFLLVSGVFGTFVSVDLFFLFFFYELAVIPMYLLIGVWGSSSTFPTFSRTKEYSAMKLVLYLVGGSILAWVAILAIYVVSQAGTFDIEVLSEVSFDPGFQRTFFPFLLVGFGVLAGLWPFHTWSPDGHVAAPTAVSMLHAGVLMKLGAFGIIRVGMTLLPEGATTWMPVLFGVATVNVLYGAISAMHQQDLKYVVGYSSVSHMGYVLMGLATMEPIGVAGAVLQMFSHGVMTALFFALVGVVYDRAHLRDIGVLEGLAKRMGWTATFFVIVGLTSLGLPGLSGFVAELLVFIGAFRTQPVLAILGIVGAAVTAVYILRLLAKVFFGPVSPRWEGLPDAKPLEAFAASILTASIVFVGLYPLPFIRMINTGVKALLDRVSGA